MAKRKEEDKGLKPKKDKQIIEECIGEINKTINFNSAKNWITNLNKKGEYLLELEKKVKSGNKSKHVFEKGKKINISFSY